MYTVKTKSTLICTVIGAQLLLSVGKATCIDEAYKLIDTKIKDQSAIAKFKAMIIGQGVNKEMAVSLCDTEHDEYSAILNILNKQSKHKIDLTATTTGTFNM